MAAPPRTATTPPAHTALRTRLVAQRASHSNPSAAAPIALHANRSQVPAPKWPGTDLPLSERPPRAGTTPPPCRRTGHLARETQTPPQAPIPAPPLPLARAPLPVRSSLRCPEPPPPAATDATAALEACRTRLLNTASDGSGAIQPALPSRAPLPPAYAPKPPPVPNPACQLATAAV